MPSDSREEKTEIETKNLDKRMNREDKEKHYTKTDV